MAVNLCHRSDPRKNRGVLLYGWPRIKWRIEHHIYRTAGFENRTIGKTLNWMVVGRISIEDISVLLAVSGEL